MASPFDLTTAAEVAVELRTTADARLGSIVTAASRLCARVMGRAKDSAPPYRRAGVVEAAAGFGRPLLLLDAAPVVAVASVTWAGVAYAASAYEVADAEQGVLRFVDGSWPDTRPAGGYGDGGWGASLAPVALHADNPTAGLVVTYSAGWVTPGQAAACTRLVDCPAAFHFPTCVRALADATVGPLVTVPEDVQEAALLAAVFMARRRGVDPFLSSEAIGSWSASYRDLGSRFGTGDPTPLPADVMALLALHSRPRVA